jgi:hypothetical protein
MLPSFALPSIVTPAKAGVQGNLSVLQPWIPAFAGMTSQNKRRQRSSHTTRGFTLSLIPSSQGEGAFLPG